MIPEQFIQELIQRVDIVDVIDRSVPLKKAGANYSACCPFHNEKSPSFTVSPTKQFYHCFGCGAHGTAISFLMEYNGMSFVEAVNDLAKSVGMIVPQEKPSEQSMARTREMPGMLDVMQQAMRYYRSQLKSSERAIAYLKGRGLTGEIAAKFQMGYAPAGWQNLQTVFGAQDYDNEVLETVGLVSVNEQGRRYDRFRDRVMFPIHDQKGVVIGFGGRIINPEDTPKYYNSPETPLFQKGHELYGLFQAKRAIREAGRVLVVEGYMDVVALAQYGIAYAVAALGTATTPFHITKLKRHADVIVFCFDGDAAGQRAAWRAAMNALPALTDGLKLTFLFLPVEHDPDSYVRAYGKEAFEQAMQQAMPLSTYLIQHLTEDNPLQSQEDKVRFLNDIEPILKQLQAPKSSLFLQKKVAELTNMSLEEIQGTLKLSVTRIKKQDPRMARARPTAPTLALKLLEIILHQPGLASALPLDKLPEQDPEYQVLHAVCMRLHSQSDLPMGALLQTVQSKLPEAAFRMLMARLMEEQETEVLRHEFEGGLRQLMVQWEKSRSSAADILRIAQEKGLQALSPEQRAILQQSRWGHGNKNPS